MRDKTGGFKTTGIWVMFRYAIPFGLFLAVLFYMSPSSRTATVHTVAGALNQFVDVSHIPGLNGGIPTGDISALASDQPADGGFWFRTFGVGKPVVTDDTPRVRLSDLPTTGAVSVVQLSDLPASIDTPTYALATGSATSKRAPVVTVSPRPARAPADLGLRPIEIAAAPSMMDKVSGFLGRMGVPVAP